MVSDPHKKVLEAYQAFERQQQTPLRYQQPPEQPAAFKQFTASELYCPTCQQAMRVKEKLLLVLPTGELSEYVCVKCGTSLGTRTT